MPTLFYYNSGNNDAPQWTLSLIPQKAAALITPLPSVTDSTGGVAGAALANVPAVTFPALLTASASLSGVNANFVTINNNFATVMAEVTKLKNRISEMVAADQAAGLRN